MANLLRKFIENMLKNIFINKLQNFTAILNKKLKKFQAFVQA